MNAAGWISRAVLVATVSMPLAANAETWQDRCQSGRFICVDVRVVDNEASVTVSLPEQILVSRNQKVVWHLPIGFAFANGDGVAVQTSSGEIASASPVDDDEGDATTLTMRYRILISRRLVSGPYKYVLKFHEMNGGNADTLITCDPTIANFNGILKGKPVARTFIDLTCRKN